MTSRDIDSVVYRNLMGRFVTGVTVVTTTSSDGHPEGMTANSLTSVSLDPPLVSVCIDRQAGMRVSLAHSDGFVINILTADQTDVSRHFAHSREDLFEGVDHHPGILGHPVLHGCLAHLECRRRDSFDAGDHTVFVGEVIGGSVGDGEPLAYYRGDYRSLDSS